MSGSSDIEWTDATWRECSSCRRTLAVTEFGRDASRSGGRTYICRECKNRKARELYVRKEPHRHGWLKPTRDGDRLQARRRVNYLVEQGRIPHPADLPCMDCCDEVFTDNPRHEYDHAKGYDGENQLYVEAVCRRCHRNREEARRGLSA